MALYEVSRTDAVQPGEFVNAVVIAGGVAQARKAVAHMTGVTAKNVRAERVDIADGIHVLSAYFDERDAEPAPAAEDTIPLF